MGLMAPVIVGELSVCSTQVRVKGQLHGARVDILLDGVAGPVGGGPADWPDQWFPLNPGVSLQPGQIVRARQSRGADVSPASGIGATVQDRSASPPQFAGPLVACTAIAVIDRLAPGATVSILDRGGMFLGKVTAAGSRAVVPLNRPIGGSEVLTATAEACGGAPAPSVDSLPAEQIHRGANGELPTPVIPPLLACMRVLHITGLQVGATLYMERDDGVYTWPVTDQELYGRVDPPLKGGESLVFRQEMGDIHCESRPSDNVSATVDPGPPGAPWIGSQPCPGSLLFWAYGLVPSATVKVMSGATELLVFEAAEESQEVDLAGVTLTPGQQLTVVQGLCDVYGPASAVPAVVTQPAEGVAPMIPERLVACAGVVRVSGVADGSFVQVYSELLKGRIGHAFATGSVVDVEVFPPLLHPLPNGQMDHIRAEVSGCARGVAEREVEGETDLPPFRIEQPIDGDRSVTVIDLLPGCLVTIVVNGHLAGEAWVAGPTGRVGVSETLRVEQRVNVTARLCGQQRSAHELYVQPGLALKWTRPTDGGLEVGGGFYMAGRVQAVESLGPTPGDRLLVGTEESGLWTVQPGGPSFPLSLDWPEVRIRSLSRGTRGDNHFYCGTAAGMMESDPGVLLPLLSWKRVNGLPGMGGIFPGAPRPGATINDILVLPGRNLVVVATNSGIWWSAIPATTAVGYAWSSDPLVNTGNMLALCQGPGDGIVCYRAGAPGGAFFAATWGGGGLQWSTTTPGTGGPPADARLTTVVARMANGALSSSPADRSRVYAAVEDSMDNAWLAVLRSDDGGRTWSIPYTDPNLTYLKPPGVGGTVDMGYQAERNLKLAAHPTNRDLVLLAGRRSGLLGSTDAAQTWDAARWPNVADNSFHADSLCIAFDRFDGSGQTVLTGGDGGIFVSRDTGVTWDTSRNQHFPTLMFDGRNSPAGQALSASSAYPGLLVGALQDNGNIYLTADGEAWQELFDGGDGFRALFVTPDVVLRGGNDDVDMKWSRWDGAKFTDPVPLEPPGYPAGSQFMPIASRVSYPAWKDPGTSNLMVAIAGDGVATGDVVGMFDKGAATNPANERFYWKKLGAVPAAIGGLATLDGRWLIVGTAGPHIYRLDTATGSVVELTLPAGLGNSAVRRVTVVGGGLAFCLAGQTLLRTTNLITWETISGPAGTSIDALEVDRARDPAVLILAGSGGAWFSRDAGNTWQPTTGLPRHTQANHLEVVDYGGGNRVIHLGSWNWSAWRAHLT
ncbi:MAG: hypothetical protein V9F06_14250 [Thermomicrobiales bacterium]